MTSPLPVPPGDGTIRDYLASLIRTVVPVWIGVLVTWLNETVGPIDVDGTLAIALAGAVASVYYAVVRKLEAKYPKLGWLLGLKGQPAYVKPAVN